MNDITACSELPVRSPPFDKVKPDAAAVDFNECPRNVNQEFPSNTELQEKANDVVKSLHSAYVDSGEYTWDKDPDEEKYLRHQFHNTDPSVLKRTYLELPEEPQINEVPFGIHREDRTPLMAMQYLPRRKSILHPETIQNEYKGTPAKSYHTGYFAARKPPKQDPSYSLWEARQPYRLKNIRKKPLDRTLLRLAGLGYTFVQPTVLARNPTKQGRGRFRISPQIPTAFANEKQFMMYVKRSPSGMPRAMAYYDKNNCALFSDDWGCWLDLDVKRPVFKFEYRGSVRRDAERQAQRRQREIPLKKLRTFLLHRNAKTRHVFQM
ncbi:hypothetical protein BZA77DRAFT_295864 [Pyronema omphalodes]|nr:hypothetical protein BZA77DRAFT_295864 [Pyronema omphalodes]